VGEIQMIKKKLAIFDLTDCEGCELQLINLKEKLINFEEYLEFCSWRLVSDKNTTDKFDIAIVEGNPVKKDEENLLKELRSRTKILIALGACAVTGGIPSMIDEKKRSEIAKLIYNESYKPKSISAKPVNQIVKVDFNIPGCPADINQIEKFLFDLINDKIPHVNPYPVCMECKLKENNCLLLDKQPCLGPVTQGGCDAACPSGGLYCYGCWGPMKNANLKALYNVYKHDLNWDENKTKKHLELFWKDIEFK
jgi:sulfhydrogenase subunit delta